MKKLSNVLDGALADFKPDKLKTMVKEYRCKLCKDEGLVLKNDVAATCSCIIAKSNASRKIAYGEALQKATFNSFDFKFYSEAALEDEVSAERQSAVKAARAAKEFVSSMKKGITPKGIMLTGNVGSGKTHLAASIANELNEMDIKAIFVVVPDLLDEVRSSYKNEEVTESDIMDAAKNAAVLILDDLGAHNYTEWTRNKIFSLLNYRLSHLLPTIITTNLDMSELEEHLGERTTSRIVELCKIYRLNVHKDIRFQKNLKNK